MADLFEKAYFLTLKPGVSVEFLWEVSEKISFALFMDVEVSNWNTKDAGGRRWGEKKRIKKKSCDVINNLYNH